MAGTGDWDDGYGWGPRLRRPRGARLRGGAPATSSTRIAAQETIFTVATENRETGRPINKIGRAIETAAKGEGFSVLRALHSHGIGRSIHEEPSVPQYYDRVGDFGTLSNPVGPYLEFRNTTGAGLASTAG